MAHVQLSSMLGQLERRLGAAALHATRLEAQNVRIRAQIREARARARSAMVHDAACPGPESPRLMLSLFPMPRSRRAQRSQPSRPPQRHATVAVNAAAAASAARLGCFATSYGSAGFGGARQPIAAPAVVASNGGCTGARTAVSTTSPSKLHVFMNCPWPNLYGWKCMWSESCAARMMMINVYCHSLRLGKVAARMSIIFPTSCVIPHMDFLNWLENDLSSNHS